MCFKTTIRKYYSFELENTIKLQQDLLSIPLSDTAHSLLQPVRGSCSILLYQEHIRDIIYRIRSLAGGCRSDTCITGTSWQLLLPG
jgi:hypothetical protein